MPNSRQSSAIASPVGRRATNCSLSSITEHSFQGIIPSPSTGRKCYLRVRYNVLPMSQVGQSACSPCVYPLLVAAAFKLFGIFTVPSFFFLVFLNILFSTAVRLPIFHAGKRVAGLGVAAAAAWLWALFPVPS